jgi:hypothetical protein
MSLCDTVIHIFSGKVYRADKRVFDSDKVRYKARDKDRLNAQLRTYFNSTRASPSKGFVRMANE